MDYGKIGSIDDLEIEEVVHGSTGTRVTLKRKPNLEEIKILKALKEVFEDPNVSNLSLELENRYYLTVHSDINITIEKLKRLEKISERKVTLSCGIYGWIVIFTEKTFEEIVDDAVEEVSK